MENSKKTNKKILLGLFDSKTQSTKEIADMMSKQIRKFDELKKDNLTTEELQGSVKPYISETTIKESLSQKNIRKGNKIIKSLAAVGNWIWSIMSWWIGWSISVIFMFFPPILVILIVWILSETEPDVYAALSMLTLFVLYWLIIFKTRLGQKSFDWIGKISGTH
jgi:hypothetical protein